MGVVSARLRLLAVILLLIGEWSGGLGLAITRRIVDDANGTIEVGDGTAGGAEFTVRIPRAASASSQSPR